MIRTADLFRALGDPVRMEMVARLASHPTYTVGSLSAGLKISRQGARKHIQVLADTRLVDLKPKGREVEVYLNSAAIRDARLWMQQLEKQWDMRLLALREFVEAKQ